MSPPQQGKRGIGRCESPRVEPAVQNQRLRHEQQREQQSQGHHGVHPPEPTRSKPIPQIQPLRHVEARQPDDERRQPREQGS